MQLCEDLGVNPDEDCVLYAIAFELKSPRMGEWNKKGWIDGWKNIGYTLHIRSLEFIAIANICTRCDSIPTMKSAINRLRDKLGSDSEYFQKVYNHTFDFARSPGQRSLRRPHFQIGLDPNA
jgi:DCN1-like protein 1/2